MKILITGAQGFVGKNLCTVLRRRDDVELYAYDLGVSDEVLADGLQNADVIFHLAGVNRPQHVEEFTEGNAGFTETICRELRALGRTPKIVFSSSIQAALDNPYGVSKREAEAALRQFSADTQADVVVHRLKNLFGKWCRPNYNSVTATFCHNIAHDLPVQVNDPAIEVELSYIDDVVAALAAEVDAPASPAFRIAEPLLSYRVTLGELADRIRSFRAIRDTLHVPAFTDPFTRALYATYLTYLDPAQFEYGLDIKSDNRGSLAEMLKSPAIGQIFVSRTWPGITRGNHYHHTKTEKFMVIQGEGIIRQRHITNEAVLEFRVRGEEYRVVEIVPGFTHSIENVGEGEMITLFWASEVFDPEHPDTFFEPVLQEAPAHA